MNDMKKKLNMKVLGGMICITVTAFITAFIAFDLHNKNKAKAIAAKYLEAEYLEQMDYKGVRLSLIDPAMYHVYFTPENNPDLTFEVLVMLDFTLPGKNNPNNPLLKYTPDDYLLEYFGYHLANELQNMTGDLGEAEIRPRIILLDQPLYSHKVSKELSENMPYKEMEAYIPYSIWFDIDKVWQHTDTHTEARKMLEMIKNIQVSGYLPKQIVFTYQSIDKEEKFITFSEWYEINDISQIEELIT